LCLNRISERLCGDGDVPADLPAISE
jgi:hypothetical protein